MARSRLPRRSCSCQVSRDIPCVTRYDERPGRNVRTMKPLVALLDGYSNRRQNSRRQRRPWLQDDGALVADLNRGSPGACTGRGTNRCALRAAQNRAEDRPADRGAANLLRGLVAWRFAETQDVFGRERQPRTVGQHDGMEADAEFRLLLVLAAAF